MHHILLKAINLRNLFLVIVSPKPIDKRTSVLTNLVILPEGQNNLESHSFGWLSLSLTPHISESNKILPGRLMLHSVGAGFYAAQLTYQSANLQELACQF
jgi:hypothetical protein